MIVCERVSVHRLHPPTQVFEASARPPLQKAVEPGAAAEGANANDFTQQTKIIVMVNALLFNCLDDNER